MKAFREPTVKNAQRTLTVIIFCWPFAGGNFLSGQDLRIAATDPGQPGYQSVLSMLTAAVLAREFFTT